MNDSLITDAISRTQQPSASVVCTQPQSTKENDKQSDEAKLPPVTELPSVDELLSYKTESSTMTELYCGVEPLLTTDSFYVACLECCSKVCSYPFSGISSCFSDWCHQK